eukprot:GHVS01095707.1.p1 GENE.GHVS01095707.1~~GHVS01095707.1.p1  ORF type:complete len:474 (+),score=29.25 GHVS01095707.1:131-1552(+)
MDSLSEAVSGGVAGCVSTFCLYPVDRVLVRFLSGSLTETELYQRGRVGLLKGCYRGVSFKVTESFVRNFIYFYVYQLLKTRYQRRTRRMGSTANLMLATVAAVLNQILTAPLEVISTNLQVSHLDLRSIVRYIYRSEGLPGFYRGLGASLFLCSNPAITNATFDRLKATTQSVTKGEQGVQLSDLTAFQSFCLGAFSKTVATIITYPHIRSKVVVQAQALRKIRVEEHPAVPDGAEACMKPTHSQHRTGSARSDTDSGTLSRLLTFFFSPGSAPPSSSDVPAPISLPSSKLHRRRHLSRATPSTCSDGYDSDKPSSSAAGASSCNVTSSVSVPRGLAMFDQRDELPLQLAKADMLRTASFCMSDVGEPIIDIDTRPPPHITRCVSDEAFEDEPDKGILQVLVSTVMQDGVLGLYQGLSLQLFKTVIAAAILYMVKERIHHTTTKVFRVIYVCLKVLRLRSRRRSFHSGRRRLL